MPVHKPVWHIMMGNYTSPPRGVTEKAKLPDAEDVAKEVYQLTAQEVLRRLKSTTEGLSDEDVKTRRAQFGPNEISEAAHEPLWLLFLKQFKSLLVLVLLLAAVLSYLTGNVVDVYIIMAVVLIDASIGFFMEMRAETAVSALKKMLNPQAKVIREGEQLVVHARELVPGDIVVLEEGDGIPADGRLVDARNIRTVESALTGESLPESKFTEPIGLVTPMADRKNMLWKGTFVVAGYGKAVVTGTGINTEIGRVAATLSSIKSGKSHFQQKINKLAAQMGVASVLFAAVLFAVGWFMLDLELKELFLISVAAMVSTIPEGLPSIIAVVLAIGTHRMAKRNAIVREFTSTETLGAVSTIITDKTGTLTENALTVRKIFVPDGSLNDIEVTGEGWFPAGNFVSNNVVIEPAGHPALPQLLKIAAYSNNASIRHVSASDTYELSGDPTEGALLVLARKGGMAAALPAIEKTSDLPFNSNLKLRATLVNEGGKSSLLVVGAPEKILALSGKFLHRDEEKPMDNAVAGEIKNKVNEWSSQAMRVIALAYKPWHKSDFDKDDVNDLVFTGLAGMLDPPRAEAKEAIQNCRKAGIRVIMATGDHISTAVAIARSVGILRDGEEGQTVALTEEQLLALDAQEFDDAISSVNVLARLSPGTKLKVAERLQQMGQLIAMTGDGVNDAPALKKADVGIAMGIMGTDVARSSAKLVLADDNFATIVSAIEEGRIVFTNARQASYFLITTNAAEITTLIAAVSLAMPVPLTAIQILWLNLVTDGIGDMALAAEKGHGEVLREKPLKKDERILNKNILPFLLLNVAIMAGLTIAAHRHFLPYGIETARSAAFTVMSFTQLFNLYNMRSLKKSLMEIGLFSNIYVTITMLSSSIITIAIIFIPFFQGIFGFGPIGYGSFLLLVALSSMVLWATEAFKYGRKLYEGLPST